MKFSAKKTAPTAFTDWLALENDDWKPNYSSLSGDPMTAVQLSLLEEQGYVCCYCGRQLPPDGSDGHIDHFWPQSHFDGIKDEDRSLDYNNFFRSCGPKGLPGVPIERPSTCGDAKGNWYDVTYSILPSDPECERRFTYGQNGGISPTSAEDTAARNMISRLRLDDMALAYERSKVIEEVEAALSDGSLATDEYRRARTAVNGRLPGFGHAVARYLEQEYHLLHQTEIT